MAGDVVERIALQRVPEAARQPWLAVAAIQAGYMVSVTSLLTGSEIVAGLPLAQTVAAGTLGYLIVVALSILQGIQGRDLGVPTVVAASSAFGVRGSRWVISGVLGASTIGWFAINANLCGAAFSALLSSQYGLDVPVAAATIGWGLVMLSTAVFGFHGLKYLNYVGVPLMTTVCVYGIYLGLDRTGLEALRAYAPGEEMTFAAAVSVVVGGYAVGAVTAADATRYQRRRVDVVYSSTIGILPAGVALLWAGAVLAIVAEQPDLTEIFVALGIPLLGVVALVMSTWPANAGNAYSAGLDAVLLFGLRDERRPLATAACGLVGIVVGCFDVLGRFLELMTLFSEVITPICGVMIADYWWRGRGRVERWRPSAGVTVAGLAGWLAGVAVARTLQVGVPAVWGVAASVVVYLLVARLLPPRPEAPPSPEPPASTDGRVADAHA